MDYLQTNHNWICALQRTAYVVYRIIVAFPSIGIHLSHKIKIV